MGPVAPWAQLYDEGGDSKTMKYHYEAAAMAGNEVARYNFGCNEYESGNMERAIKHWLMHQLGNKE
jgi:hypothetical protein